MSPAKLKEIFPVPFFILCPLIFTAVIRSSSPRIPCNPPPRPIWTRNFRCACC